MTRKPYRQYSRDYKVEATAPMGSFFHTLKTELITHCDYQTRD